MMLLPVLRPVQKSASRLLLAGTNAAVDLTEHGAPLEVPQATVQAWNQPGQDLPRQANVLAQPWQAARWPVVVENLIAGASGSQSSATEVQEEESQDGQLSETGAHCMWQMDAHAVFPHGACVWPAIFMTSDGCFSAGFPVVPASTAQPPAGTPVDSGSSSPRGALRTSASRKQRRHLKADVKNEEVPKAPALVGLQAKEVPLSPGPIEQEQQLWPPTPESTPPCSPREWAQYAYPGLWPIEVPQSLPAEPKLAELPVEQDEEAKAYEQMIAELDSGSRAEVLNLLWSSTWSMSCTPHGTRVVQKALEVTDTSERVVLAEQLKGHVLEAFVSPHANHVLQKCIELIPPEKLGFLFEEMSGHAVTAARHRYGCRVLERLLEHCPSSQTAPLIEEVLLGTQQLCRHTFGNFVVQHVLEHGSPQQRHEVVEVIHSDIQRLARHRVASHVVRCALKRSSPEDRQKLVQAIRKDPADLADLAHHHCGSFVVREMRRSDGPRR